MSQLKILLCIALSVCGHSLLWAKNYIYQPLPIGSLRPVGTATLFPPYASAAAVNSAGLPASGVGPLMQVGYGPSLTANDPHQLVTSYSTSGGVLGAGFGYQMGSNNGVVNHGVYAGMGVDMETLAFGTGLRDTSIEAQFDPEVDMAFSTISKRGFGAGVVVYHIEKTPQFNLSVGFTKRKISIPFSVELNVLLPGSSSAGNFNSAYIITLAGTVKVAPWSFYSGTAYNTVDKRYEETLGVAHLFSPSFQALVQYTNPQTIFFGLSLFI